MVDRREKRRLKKMQQEREKEEQQESRSRRTKTSVTAVAAAGAAYAGYRYRGEITNVAKDATSKAAETIGRVTGNEDFQQRVRETKNVMEAVSATYNQEQGGLSNTVSSLIQNVNPRKRQEAIRRRTGILNRSTQERARRENIPQDIRNAMEELTGYSGDTYTSAQMRNLKDILGEERFEDTLGRRQEELLAITRESTKRRGENLFQYRVESDKSGEVDVNIIETLRKYSQNDDVNIDLDFEDDDDILETARDFQRAIKDTKRRTSAQSRAYHEEMKRKPHQQDFSRLKGNLFAEEKSLETAVRFQSIQSRSLEDANFMQESLMGEGWQPLTMKDARQRVRREDGKLFIDREKGPGQTIDELFSPAREGRVGLAETFEDLGRRIGADSETIDNALFSTNLFVNPETDELLNMGAAQNALEDSMNFLQDNFQVPVIGVNPLDFLQRTFGRQQSNLPGSAFYRTGNVSSFTGEVLETMQDVHTRNEESAGVLARDYFQIGETIYDTSLQEGLLDTENGSIYENFVDRLSDSVVAEGYEILNTRQGAGRDYADVLSGRLSEDAKDQGLLARIAGIDPDHETIYQDVRDAINSYEDASFGQNQPVAIARDIGLGDYDRAAREIEELGQKIDARTVGVSADVAEDLHGVFADAIAKDLGNPAIDESMFQSSEGLLEITELINSSYGKQSAQRPPEDTKQRVLHELKGEIGRIYDFAADDPDSYLGRKKYMFNNALGDSDFAGITGADKPAIYSGEDTLRGLIEQYGALAMDRQGVDIDGIFSDNILSNKGQIVEELDQLRTRTEARFFGKEMQRAGTPQDRANLANEWVDHFGQEDTFKNLFDIMGEIEPFGKQGIDTNYQSLSNTPYMPIKKHRGLLRGINEEYTNVRYGDKHAVTGILSALGDAANPFTGHQGEPTTASVTPWRIMNNLNRPLEKFGLGIPKSQRKTPVSIMTNLSINRLLLPVVGFQTAKSVDDFFFEGGGRRRLAQGYANIHTGMAGIRDRIGLTSLSEELNTYIPGMEHLRGSPVGMAARGLSFGLLADDRSQEELEEYYRSGEDPIRKGRWWELGSATPWIGDRIEYYRPNWYRRTMSDYEYTDTMYGSREEYWSNHWMPNIYNPLAPINHFLRDPYHYEEKHELSRPYAVTGGFPVLQAIPVIGPAVDSVVSGVLKPQRENPRLEKAHRDYLRAENEQLISAYTGVNSPGLIDITPKGKVSLTTNAPEVNIIDEETGLVDEEALITDDIRFASEREGIGQGVANSGAAQGMPIQITVTDAVRGQLAQYNTALAGVPEGGRVFDPSTVHSQVNPYRVHSTDEAIRANSDPRAMLIHATDQMQDMGGMFGFLSANALGATTDDNRMRLEDSSQFGSFNRRFWDMNLGGFDGIGGDISEIARRFIGGNRRYNYYNPIRNQMPSWMPGQNYFIDFQHGDPYSKIPYGEIRLPGESYEQIYNVQKDEFGNYSAFDRYRILADTAPYSDEYRLAKSEVALLNQNGLLSEERQEEYRTIREQVSTKNKKHKFYPRRYGNAEINRETVTIDKVIDQNTFLTKEYPNNPIKLAGVSIKADDEANVALMKSMLQPGSKVQVGLDADPMKRERDDMMDTMRAVVYAPKNVSYNFQNPLRRGQNVNQFLSNQSEEDGGTISIKDDGTAVATAALHSEGQITVGKTMEWIAHDLLPNIPFVNILADKFYPVRTPVEEYERLTYSKSFRSWQRPVRDWIMPMLDTATNMNPFVSAARGAGIASMFSRSPNKQALYAKAGASIYGTLSGIRSIAEFGNRMLGNNERWLPKRREQQRNVDEYFDRIQYIKYKGLYEQAKELAESEEGIDIDEYLRLTEEEGQSNASYQSYLEEQKKWINIASKSSESQTVKDYSKGRLEGINNRLKQIDERRPNQLVGSYTALALRYKEEYESTLYGAKDTYDYMKIYRSLPKKDKEFFTAFQDASPEERQEILSLVPKNQRNIYRKQWGLDIDPEDDVSLEEYFSDYRLPDEDWEGWRPEVSLENIKIKVMQNEGMELTEANYWDEHVDRAEMDPSQPISIDPVPNTPLAGRINQDRLKKALEGAGLEDVRIGLRQSAADVSYFNTQMTITRNREEEVEQGIEEYLNS